MRIVFGWNTLKVRSFSLLELGIIKETEPGLTFEVRQAYFHLFWIPFFGLGKRWVVRKGNNMYEMPLEIQQLAKSSLTGIRTPWYTFSGPLLLLTAFIIFTSYTKINTYQRNKRSASAFKERAEALTAKMQHLTTNDFITLNNVGSVSETVYLKVEDIKGDEIMVTPVTSTSDKPMKVEYEYTQHAGTLPSVKVSHNQLLAAFPKNEDSATGIWLQQLANNFFNDDRKFVVADVVRHFCPIIKSSYASYYNKTISIHCNNIGWPAIITEMKNIVGNIDWSQVINTGFPDNQSSYSTFDGQGGIYAEPYKVQMTLKDTTGRLHKFEIAGKGNGVTIIPL